MQYKITFKHTIIGILLIVFTVGCASVRLRSFQDPEYRGKQFERVIVEAKFQDLAKREKFEYEFARDLRAEKIYAVPSIDLIPPTRQLTEDTKEKVIEEYEIDSWLTIKMVSYDNETVSNYSNNGGFSNTIHYSTIRSELFDVSNWQTAHIINCQFQGDSCAGGKSAIPEHTSTKVVDYLIDKRIMSRSLR